MRAIFFSRMRRKSIALFLCVFLLTHYLDILIQPSFLFIFCYVCLLGFYAQDGLSKKINVCCSTTFRAKEKTLHMSVIALVVVITCITDFDLALLTGVSFLIFIRSYSLIFRPVRLWDVIACIFYTFFVLMIVQWILVIRCNTQQGFLFDFFYSVFMGLYTTRKVVHYAGYLFFMYAFIEWLLYAIVTIVITTKELKTI